MTSRGGQQFILSSASVLAGVGAVWLWQRYQRRHKKFGVPESVRASPFAVHAQLAIRLALQAGENMRRFCDETGTAAAEAHDFGISIKTGVEDFYTAIDVENENLVTHGIAQVFPTDQIIGEESVGIGGIPPLTDVPTWIIDPIDGTTNFASGFPLTCVSIGYCVDRVPVLGVVYAPMTDELFLGVSGYGCFRNGVRITPRTHKELRDAVVCFEFGYSRQGAQISRMIGAVNSLLHHGVRATRQVGSGVLDLCYVATGRLDAVYAGIAGEGWKPWDYCAGLVIAQEAGCAIQAIDQIGSEPFDIYSKSIICAVSQTLLEQIRQNIKN